MAPQRFKARLEVGGEGNAWVLLKLPFDAAAVFGSKGNIRVKGTLNGTPYETSIFPGGDGTHHMMVNKALQQSAGVKAGSTVDVTMEINTETPRVQLPDDFRAALRSSSKAFKTFEALSPSKKKYLVQRIGEAKKPETRRRRIEEAIRELGGTTSSRSTVPRKSSGSKSSSPRALRAGDHNKSAGRCAL
jgi:hypothetical protein